MRVRATKRCGSGVLAALSIFGLGACSEAQERVVELADASADGASGSEDSDGGSPDAGRSDGGDLDGGDLEVESGEDGEAGVEGVACDPVDHDGCGAGALCCLVDDVPACLGGSPEACEACGEPCGVGADGCSDRTCTCGGGAACAGDTPVCAGGECVACDGDESVCTAQGLVCDTESHSCVQCLDGDDCDAGEVCNAEAGSCVECTASDDAVCTAAGEVCDAETGSCVECTASDDAVCTAAGEVCDAETGSCVECTAEEDGACTEGEEVCDAEAGVCVECTASDDSVCAAQGLSCDVSSGSCVDALAPWRPDCSNLPSHATCQGGPVEVLMLMHYSGLVALFDPADGTFLGYWKQNDLPMGTNYNRYFMATQGPDMCIWTTRETDSLDRGVERWNTDGTYLDEIIPTGEHFVFDEGSDRDVIVDPGALAFTEDRVYVAARGGYPNPRLLEFDLDGELQRVVLDDGSELNDLVVLGDGRLVIGDRDFSSRGVFLLSSDGTTREPLWPDMEPWQIRYTGGGEVAVAQGSFPGNLGLVDVTSQERTEINPDTEFVTDLRGLWPLEDGRFLITASGSEVLVSALEPGPNPAQFSVKWDDPAVSLRWRYFGTACLPQAVVDTVTAEDPPVSSCDIPAGEAIVSQDFESGDFEGDGDSRNYEGFEDPNGRASIDAGGGADGSSRSLRIEGGDSSFYNGVTVYVDDVQPSYVGYWIRVDTAPTAWSYLFLGMSVMHADPPTGHTSAVGFRRDDLGAWNTRLEKSIEHDTWYHVELRDFDWEAGTYDIYVDCERLVNDARFSDTAPDFVGRIDFFNRETTASAWIDELIVK